VPRLLRSVQQHDEGLSPLPRRGCKYPLEVVGTSHLMKRGEPLVLVSRAGETHTFTRVAAFGGGFIPLLNTLSGNPTPRAECATEIVDAKGNFVPQPPSTTNRFVAAGSTQNGLTADTLDLPRGTTRWQCCIHPWMRTKITVR